MKRGTLIECTLTNLQNVSESTLEVTSVTLTMKTRFDCRRTCVNDMEGGFVEHLVDPENLKVGCEDTYSIQ